MASATEFELITILKEVAGTHPDLRLGIGDDAALIATRPGERLVVSCDTLVAGVHFPADSEAEDIGHKALAVNLSDLSAMGADPAWFTLALTLPKPDLRFVRGLARGMAQLIEQFPVQLIGGDTTRGPLAVSVTVLGYVPEALALRRDRAQVADQIWLTGIPGEAASALHAWQHQRAAPLRLNQRLRRPIPRVREALALRGLARAAIDVSDGLLGDLAHLCAASGVGARLWLESLPQSAALRAYWGRDIDAMRFHQLGGGDDYELLFTAPADHEDAIAQTLAALDCPATVIGDCSTQNEIVVYDRDGRPLLPKLRGYDHFRTDPA